MTLFDATTTREVELPELGDGERYWIVVLGRKDRNAIIAAPTAQAAAREAVRSCSVLDLERGVQAFVSPWKPHAAFHIEYDLKGDDGDHFYGHPDAQVVVLERPVPEC